MRKTDDYLNLYMLFSGYCFLATMLQNWNVDTVPTTNVLVLLDGTWSLKGNGNYMHNYFQSPNNCRCDILILQVFFPPVNKKTESKGTEFSLNSGNNFVLPNKNSYISTTVVK